MSHYDYFPQIYFGNHFLGNHFLGNHFLGTHTQAIIFRKLIPEKHFPTISLQNPHIGYLYPNITSELLTYKFFTYLKSSLFLIPSLDYPHYFNLCYLTVFLPSFISLSHNNGVLKLYCEYVSSDHILFLYSFSTDTSFSFSASISYFPLLPISRYFLLPESSISHRPYSL